MKELEVASCVEESTNVRRSCPSLLESNSEESGKNDLVHRVREFARMDVTLSTAVDLCQPLYVRLTCHGVLADVSR